MRNERCHPSLLDLSSRSAAAQFAGERADQLPHLSVILHQIPTRVSSFRRPCLVGSRRAKPQTVRTCAVRLAAGTQAAFHCSTELCAHRMQPTRAQRCAAVPVRLLMHHCTGWSCLVSRPPSFYHAPDTPADARAARKTCGMPRRSMAACGTCTSPGTFTPSAHPRRSTLVQAAALADLEVVAGLFAVSCIATLACSDVPGMQGAARHSLHRVC